MIAILQLVEAAQTPLLAILLIIVYRIKINDLSHIHEKISEIAERLARLEGSGGVATTPLRKKDR